MLVRLGATRRDAGDGGAAAAHVRSPESAREGDRAAGIDSRAGAVASGRLWFRAYLWRVVVSDLASAAIATTLATLLGPGGELHREYALISAGIVVIWPILILLLHGYDRRYLGVTVEEYRALGAATLSLLGVAGVLAVSLNVLPSRAYLLVVLPALFTLSFVAHRLCRAWLKGQRTQGRLMQRALIVGHPDAAQDLIRSLRECPDQGLLPVAVCDATDRDKATAGGSEAASRSWDGADDVLLALEQCGADVVIALTSAPGLRGASLRRLAWLLEEREVELLVSMGVLDVAGPRMTIRPSEQFSLLHIERPAATKAHVFHKSVLDRMMALLLIFVLLPLLVAVAIAVKLTSRGPVLFRQTRIGAGGKPFQIFKFRTMVVGAERQQQSLHHLSDGNAVQFKMRRDPRVTAVGAVLRRYSLDELPQLFNVLLGDMSLVGPRPQSQQEVDQYEPDALRRLRVRPGMTGLWQISGRSNLDWEQSLRLDLRYVDNWSPVVDLQILVRTLRAVVSGSGAY